MTSEKLFEQASALIQKNDALQEVSQLYGYGGKDGS